MQVFDLRRKNMFHLRCKPSGFLYLVFYLKSKFIHLTQMVVLYWLLLYIVVTISLLIG